MGIEIERKFLVQGDRWRGQGTATAYSQGYIAIEDARTVRVRIAGDRAYLTIKGPATGLARPEYEYPIPLTDAQELLAHLCGTPPVEKIRHRIPTGDGLAWEVDEFLGANAGLILAEIELDDPDRPFDRPEWLGEEVSDDPRYRNSYLASHPYGQWSP
jgi:adenylate cyclase